MTALHYCGIWPTIWNLMANPAIPKIASAALTKELKKLASEIIAVDEGGESITREQALARTLWNLANGWVEKTRDDHGNLKEIRHPPVAWAIQYVYERCEGRAAPMATEDVDRVRAADKVRELSRDRLNKLAGSK
jgi:hypothetical protein